VIGSQTSEVEPQQPLEVQQLATASPSETLRATAPYFSRTAVVSSAVFVVGVCIVVSLMVVLR
jgi:hypothetical protein